MVRRIVGVDGKGVLELMLEWCLSRFGLGWLRRWWKRGCISRVGLSLRKD
jgi:hypothetical protein